MMNAGSRASRYDASVNVPDCSAITTRLADLRAQTILKSSAQTMHRHLHCALLHPQRHACLGLRNRRSVARQENLELIEDRSAFARFMLAPQLILSLLQKHRCPGPVKESFRCRVVHLFKGITILRARIMHGNDLICATPL
jgi:hypothetical protein